MGKKQTIVTANDNAPDVQAASQLIANSASFVPDADRSSLSNTPSTYNSPKAHSGSLKITFIVWITCLAFFLISLLTQTSLGMKSFSALALLWSGLWSSYVAADHQRWRLSEISIVTAIMGLMGALSQGGQYLGINLTLLDNVLLMSILALIFGFSMRSRIAILTSICATLLWAMMSLSGLTPFNNLLILFPIFTLAQIYVGSRINSGLSIGLATFTGYFALIGSLISLWINDALPLTYASSLLFIIGAAHHRSGKAAEDKNIVGNNIHIYCGWFAAMVGAIIFQYFWLDPDAALASSAALSPSGLTMWKAVTGLSIMTIFISGIIRFKYTQISLPGIFLLTACSALIPLMMWVPNLPETIAADIPGVNTIPTFGVLIGAGIIAAAIGIAINGVRRNSPFMMGFGLLTLMIQAYILFSPGLITIDNIIIFFTALISALALGGAIAGNSLAFKAPPPRLKPA